MKKSRSVFAALSIFLCLLVCVSGCGAGDGSAAGSTTAVSSAAAASSPSGASSAAASATTTAQTAATATSATSAAQTTATTSAPQETAIRQYRWDETTFELTEVTEELGEWKARLKSPEGKYVMAVFTITEGRFEPGRLDELVVDQANIRLDGHAPVTMSAAGIRIEDNTAYAIGTIHVFFDVPKDLDPAKAEVTVNEDIPEAAAPEVQTPEEQGVALEEGAAFRWGEYEGSVVRTDTGGIKSGMFTLTPAGMKEDEYCFNLYLLVDRALLDDEELADAFYEAAVLTDSEGNTYAPAVSAKPSEGADYMFLYAIPNGVEAEDLRLTFTPAGTAPASGTPKTEEEPKETKTGTGTEPKTGSLHREDSLLYALWESLDPESGIHMEYTENIRVAGDSMESHYSIHQAGELYYSDEAMRFEDLTFHMLTYCKDGVEYILDNEFMSGTSFDGEKAEGGVSSLSSLYWAFEECMDLPELEVEQRSYNGQHCTVEIFRPDEYTTNEFYFDPDGRLVFHREIMSSGAADDEEIEIKHEIDAVDADVDQDLLNLDLSKYTITKGTGS